MGGVRTTRGRVRLSLEASQDKEKSREGTIETERVSRTQRVIYRYRVRANLLSDFNADDLEFRN
jgi:hypothetical protein